MGVVLGILAGSIALVGFGIDSFIEMSSGLILLWRLQTRRDAEVAERAEAAALRLVGLSLLALTSYILYDSAAALAMTPFIAREGLEAHTQDVAM